MIQDLPLHWTSTKLQNTMEHMSDPPTLLHISDEAMHIHFLILFGASSGWMLISCDLDVIPMAFCNSEGL